MSYLAIASSLTTILTTVKNASGSYLAEVYDYDIPSPESDTGYPYACISNGDAKEEILDSANNTIAYPMTIRVCDLAVDKSASEAVMRKVCDDILAELRKKTNLYLGGSVENTLPFSVSWKWESGASSPIRICEIVINAQVSKSTL